MDIIITIRDEDFGLKFTDVPALEERRASRAIVFDKQGNVALCHAVNKKYHKLPGGGIEEGESIIDAARREVSEEIGCAIENVRELGAVEEFRGQFSLHQISYCFLADLSGAKGTPHLEVDEIEDGFKTIWVPLAEAIAIVERDAPVESYEGKFIQKRDLALLRLAAREIGI